MLSTYGEEQYALLNTSETSVLKSALSVLNRLGEAAGDAKNRGNQTAKRVKAEKEARYKAAHAAIKTAFPDLQMTDAILLLCHMGDVVNYELLKVARTKPSGTDWAFDFMSDVRDMQRAAIDGAETRVSNAMLRDGSTASAADALRTGSSKAGQSCLPDKICYLQIAQLGRCSRNTSLADRQPGIQQFESLS